MQGALTDDRRLQRLRIWNVVVGLILAVQAAAIARECGAPMMKLQYPGSLEGCRAVTDALGDIPWAVLSAGVDHETFMLNLRNALRGGAAGAAGGAAAGAAIATWPTRAAA